MFWKKKSSLKGGPPKTPENTRIYAIGDIHGHADLLTKLHDVILADCRNCTADNKILVYLGDYIDRGIQTKEVIQLLVDNPLEGFNKIYLKGNHEDAMLTFLEEPEFGDVWLAWGGEATIRSYGVALHNKNSRIDMAQLSRQLKDAIPADHEGFFKNLKISHVEGDYIFVHAGLKPGVAIEKQSVEDMLTIREEFIFSHKKFAKTVVFGHTIFSEPFQKNGRIGVDTGAYAYGNLTCVVLEDENVRFLTVSADDETVDTHIEVD